MVTVARDDFEAPKELKLFRIREIQQIERD
jgi:hypothetical protein